ncbi:hypothetical protein JNK13_01175 [bacterium]|nr:hypothetical protein [bacterium]
MLFLPFRPALLSFKNRLKSEEWPRALILLLTIAGISVVIYFASLESLRSINGNGQDLIYPLRRLISSLTSVIFVLLCFSNIVGALNFLYLSADLSLLLVTPISPTALFFNRLTVSMINSSWVMALLSIPALLALADALNLSPVYTLQSLAIVFLLFTIPAGLGACVATLLVSLCPPERLRQILTIISFVVVAILLLYLHSGANSLHSSATSSIRQIIEYNLTSNSYLEFWFPPAWATSALLAPLLPQGSAANPELEFLLLFSSALAATAVAFLAYEFLFLQGHSQSTTQEKSAHESTIIFADLLPAQYRAILSKEWHTLTRDMSQLVQLILFVSLGILYLGHLKQLAARPPSDLSGTDWWSSGLLISAYILNSCVLGAIVGRFVYPTISLEGRSYPTLLRAAPLWVGDYVTIKFAIFATATGMISILMALISGFNLAYNTLGLILYVGLHIATSILLVAYALRTGCYYARFDWEAPSQVISNMGSLVFMVHSFILMIAHIPFALIIIGLGSVPSTQLQIGVFWPVILGGVILVYTSMTIKLTREALKKGSLSLLRKGGFVGAQEPLH